MEIGTATRALLEQHLAEEIVRARKAAKLTQRELAERAGVNQAMVSRARLPRLETLLAIAEATGSVLDLRLTRSRTVTGPLKIR